MYYNYLLSAAKGKVDILFFIRRHCNTIGKLASLLLVGVSFIFANQFPYDSSLNSLQSKQSNTHSSLPNKPNVNLIKKHLASPASALTSLTNKYRAVNYANITSAKDAAKTFVGVNNFLALAAEMEGFRGDLHKDPAYGLNIGFGYNISQRLKSSESKVRLELLSIGLSNELIDELIDMANIPQSSLQDGINSFNNSHKYVKNQIINIKQGLALLYVLQSEYKLSAERIFNKSFSKMNRHQQEVLTYVAYKAGEGNLQKYKDAINKANYVYSKKKTPNVEDLRQVANELSFYYKKDGKKLVLDKRAVLIANTFVHQDYLSKTVGRNDNIVNSDKFLDKNKVSFKSTSNLKSNTVNNKNRDRKPQIKNNSNNKLS